MKNKQILTVLVALLFLCGTVATASAVNLTVDNTTTYAGDTTATVKITVDDPSEIAGAAFTITYDTAALGLIDIDSAFFDTFAKQNITPSSVTVDGITYDQPLLANDVTGTGTMVAAARVEAGETKTTLFTLTFNIAGAALGTYPVSIEQSVIDNVDAGYSATGEAIPYLVGADTDQVDLALAFPVIAATVTAGAVEVTDGARPYVKGDANEDGSINAGDAILILRYSVGLSTVSDAQKLACEVNNDGSINAGDAIQILRYSVGLSSTLD